jgi:hypothetical protein
MKTKAVIYFIIALIFTFGIIGIFSVSVTPEVPKVKAEILSVEREYQICRKNFQYRIMLPDSTIAIYRSNDILYVGDKIKI